MSSKLRKFQKELKSKQTNAETLLWQYIRDRRLQGFKFKRQHILHDYIVDFICIEAQLIIELDGGQHVDQMSYDMKRTQIFENDGYTVIRFWNNDVLSNIEGVIAMILEPLTRREAPTSPPGGEVKKSLEELS